MKRTSILILALCLILALTACTKATPAPTTAPATAAPADTGAAATTAPAAQSVYPIVPDKLTLTFWVPLGFKQQTVMSSWDGISFFKVAEQKTNIHLEFMHPPVGGELDQLNTMIAARNLPDIIDYSNWDGLPGGPGKMISDGIITDIAPLVQKDAPNLLAYWDKNPDLRKFTFTDQKECFGMPYYWPDGDYCYHFGFVIRGDWAKALKVAPPTDVASWHAYLEAVKNGDPNGNKKQDELPYIAQSLADFMQTQRMFGVEPNQLFYLEKGQVVTAVEQPGYKQWVQTMAQWYKEGLLDPDILSTDRTTMDSKVLNDQAGALWSGAGTGQLGLYMKQKQNSGNTTFSIDPVSIPTTADGERLGWVKIVPSDAAAITTANKHPDESIRYLDYFFSDEGHLLSQIGPEGEAYNMVNGQIQFTDEVTKNAKGLSFDSSLIQHGLAPMDFVGYEVQDYWKYNISFSPQAQSSNELWHDYTVYKLLNGLRFTGDETSTVADITNDVNPMIQETVSKIILGQEDISKFDEMVSQVKGMGMPDLLKIYQDAYTRSQSR